MIKVTVKENTVVRDAGATVHEVKNVVKEHKDGTWAMVHNGVLSVYSDESKGTDVIPAAMRAIAGYEPGSWLSWEKA
jgi:hypothetical protein